MSKASAATETARERAEARSAKRALLIEACKAVDHLQREAALGKKIFSPAYITGARIWNFGY
jgi:hypothetical protein